MKTSHVLFGLGGIAGLVVFVVYYDAAFPAAAIDLDLSREAIAQRATDYVRARGIDPDTFQSTLTFQVDETAADFLQRVRGLEATSRFAREQLALWNWRARWFRSGETEEYVLRLTPDGRPLRYAHIIPDAAAGDSLSQDSARAAATTFLRDQLDVDVASWRLEDQSTQARDNRIDHSFTWEKLGSKIEWRPDDPEAGTASMRLSVQVHGSEIGGFSRYLEVPEQFVRDQGKTTSLGQLLTIISLGLMLVLIIAAAAVTIVRFKQDRVRWRPGFVAGGLVALTVLASGVLSLPLLKSQYSTEVAYPTFLGIAAIGGLIAAILYCLAIAVSTAAGESLAADSFPRGIRGWRDWTARRWVTGETAGEVLRGYAVGLVFLGYITVFYLLGQRYLGVWLPADSPHSELLSMYLPWLVPLLIGTQAALSEELLLRLFAVSFVKRYARLTVVALVVPAMIWAFGHSNYPVYPVYVRGIELTVAGTFFGWIFIRYGLLATVLAHYTIDAVLIAMPLLRAAGGGYVYYGVVALAFAAAPLVVPVLWAVRGRPATA